MVVLNLRDDCVARAATNFRRGMTDKRFLELEITAWLGSKERKRQLAGEAYYDGAQDVLRRKRIALDDDGKVKVLDHLPNNRLVNNIYAKMVDQKTNYSFGRPFSFDTENKAYAAALSTVFGSRFQRTMHNIGEGAWIGGKSWVFPYYDQNGELAFQRFPADEVLPFWADADHTILDAAVHVYVVLEYDETEQTRDVVKVEVMHGGGVDCFVLRDDGTLEPDDFARSGPYITTTDPQTGKETSYNWERIPLVCFKSSQAVFERYVQPGSVADGAFSGTPHFDSRIQKVKMNFANDMTDPRGPATTFFHEHGHYIDFMSCAGSGYTSMQTPDFGDALKKDFEAYVKATMKAHGTKRKTDAYAINYLPSTEQTELVRELWRGPIVSAEQNASVPNMLDVKIIIDDSVGNFIVREMGLFDEDGTLIAICNTPDTEKVAISTGVDGRLTMLMHIVVVDSSVLEFTITPSLDTVSPEDLEEAIAEHNTDPASHSDIRQDITDTVDDHNTDETSHPDIRVDLSGLDSRLSVLELKYGTNVTGNSFEVTFGTLTGVVVTGVWNETYARIEF